MTIPIGDKFIRIPVEDTRCPDKIKAITPSAKSVYLLKERFDCSHWGTVKDCFHQVNGSYILTEPIAARRHYTLCPKKVISRLTKAGVW